MLTGSTENLARSGRPRKLNKAGKAFIESQIFSSENRESLGLMCGFLQMDEGFY